MAVPNDEMRLIDACRAGATEAFGELVRRYEDRLYPTIFRLTGCAEDACDVIQDAFLRAFEKLHRFHGESSFYTWIYRIAVNLALSGRRRRRWTARLAEGPRGEPIDPPDDSALADPTAHLERAERDAQVQRALNALAPDHRAVVVLKDLDGLRYEEIAEVLRVPIGTVRSRLHRARAELRERLRGLVDEAIVKTDALSHS
ncbi:MAG TPA: sigma-70 family RNA polymerase sigma factor [Isosphaeraceae bacterium]|jgi:RNA polymerase sigma-70 factor (ECF subfamily)|nr:sigma-70 family RNA polymerase sigma factor [Isosphaeraceae bacterium]